MRRKNLTGGVFGRLTALSLEIDGVAVDAATFWDTPLTVQKGGFWVCKCECGVTKPVRADRLLSGKTRSCGCLQRDIAKASGNDAVEYARLLAWSEAEKQHAGNRRDLPFFPDPPYRGGPTDREHGLVPGTYDWMFRVQGGVCAICGVAPAPGHRLQLDHDHETEEVRGLLCNECNLGLGCFADDITRMAKAMKYLTDERLGIFRGLEAERKVTQHYGRIFTGKNLTGG
jgi:hypothetical protein